MAWALRELQLHQPAERQGVPRAALNQGETSRTLLERLFNERVFLYHFWSAEMGCGVVWCGVVWCGVVWCGVVWCAEGAVTKRQKAGTSTHGYR